MTDLDFEKQLQSTTKGMDYPRTPDIAGSVMTRLRNVPSPSGRGAGGDEHPRFALNRLAWSLTITLLLLSSLMLVPSVRAAVIEFIQIGIVRIFPQTIAPVPQVGTPATPLTATPGNSAPLLISFLDQIAGETDLTSAQQVVQYQVLLPTYPADLGQPNRVYVQDAEGAMTILVWTAPQQPERVKMSLHLIPAGHWAINKFGPVEIQETEVNGQRAIWAVGPYPLLMRNGNLLVERLINGHVLIWVDDMMTYRLETELPIEEAIKIAESLQPIP